MPDAFRAKASADVTAGEQAAYKAGKIDQRLDDHAEHLKAINGSIEQGATALAELATTLAEVKTTIKLVGAGVVLLAPLLVAILLKFN